MFQPFLSSVVYILWIIILNYILENKPDDYDAFCVFDADNIVSPDFFLEMNKKLCGGEKIVQGYRDIKNAGV